MSQSTEDLAFGFKEGAELLMQQGAMLALMPIEKWLADLHHADAIAPILDPTLYRDYIQSRRDEMLKEVLTGALHFKKAIQKAQIDFTEGRLR